MNIILASSSPNRKQLLSKLGIPFTVHQPNIDESHLPSESAHELVYRLSQQKARTIANNHQGLIIGCDQVALVDDQILTKPLNYDKALAQLLQCAGKQIDFLTGLTVLNTDKPEQIQTIIEPTLVHFRALTKTQIENYLAREQPYHCAGSVKAEALGITLINAIESRDPNTLIGLPLIALIDMLAKEGIDVL